MENTGKGNFIARAFTFKAVDGTEKTWVGRGRFPKELQVALDAEKSRGETVIADALAAHKKNKPTGNPVGRPRGSISKEVIKTMVADTVAKAD